MPGFNVGTGSPNNILDIPNTKEFHRPHRCIVRYIGFPSSINSSITTSDRFELYTKSIQLPTLELKEKQIESGSTIKYKLAVGANWKPITIKFYDVYGLYEKFLKWQELMWNATNGIGMAKDYKGTVRIQQLNGSGEPMIEYDMFGAYPKSIDHGELSHESSEIKLLSITYSYDFAKIKPLSNQ